MPGQNRMGSFAAHRQRAAQQMTHALGKGSICCAVEDRQVHLDIGDHHIPHDAVTCDVELVCVILGCPLEQIL